MAWQAKIESVDPNMRDLANVYCNVALYDDEIADPNDPQGGPLVQFVVQVVFPVGGTKDDLFALVVEKGKQARACYQAAADLIGQAAKMVIPIPQGK